MVGSAPQDAPREDPVGGSTPRGDAEDVWHRVHPLTPFVRSWLLLVALVWGIGNTFLDDAVSSLARGEPVSVDIGGAAQVVGVGLGLAVLCGVLGVLIGLGLLSWWFIRYQITQEHVRFRSGWLFRTQRQARLDRVQGIDIERKFLPRLLGLSSLKFDVADGGSSVLELSYLGREHAQQLRRQLLGAAQRAGAQPGWQNGPSAPCDRSAAVPGAPDPSRQRSDGTALTARPVPWAAAPAEGVDRPVEGGGCAAPAADTSSPHGGVDVRVAQKYGLLRDQDETRRVFTVPTGRVVLGLVSSPLTVVLLLLAVVVAGLWVWLPEALVVVLPSAIAPLLGLVSGLYSRLERSWGFTLSEVPTGVRTRAGLFNERSSTIPTGRVQALEVTAPLLWRFFGGHKVTVTTAGKGGVEDLESLESVVLPVGTWANVQQVLELLLPLERTPTELVSEGLRGIGDAGAFTTSPRRARWLDPLTWRRTGFAVDDAVLVLRRGRLTRQTSVVPHHKTQSAALSQGPVERRMGLSGFAVHVTPGAVTTSLEHLDTAAARQLQRRQAHLARLARDRADGRTPPGAPAQRAAPPWSGTVR